MCLPCDPCGDGLGASAGYGEVGLDIDENSIDESRKGGPDQGQINSLELMLCNQQEWQTEKDGWMCVKSLVDSGCVDMVAPPAAVPFLPVVISEGSRLKREYTVASGEGLPNFGEKAVTGLDAYGQDLDITYQVADVTRPLNSVSELCDRGARVIFGRGGGYIYHLGSGKVTPFRRSGRLYELDQWVRVPEADSNPSAVSVASSHRRVNNSDF